MVRKHNILAALALTIGIGAGVGGVMMQRNYEAKQRAYKQLVRKEAAKFKGCPDRLKAGYGSCATYDQRVSLKEQAKEHAANKRFLKAGQFYIELGDWINAKAMAGRCSSGDRKILKREIKIRRDAIKVACPECKLK